MKVHKNVTIVNFDDTFVIKFEDGSIAIGAYTDERERYESVADFKQARPELAEALEGAL